MPPVPTTATAAGLIGSFVHDGRTYRRVDIAAACEREGRDLARLPFAVRVFLENVARQAVLPRFGRASGAEIAACVHFENHVGTALPLAVPRVILPDSSGVPALQDIASLRSALARSGGRPEALSPRIPVDLVIDHSVQVDEAGHPGALAANTRMEMRRNAERYRFIKWADRAFPSLRVFPPGTGIVHQVNLEHVARVVFVDDTEIAGREGGKAGTAPLCFPDFVLGGDSHTPMVNAIGVLGWGVGGVDAVAAMLGHGYVVAMPEIVGVRLDGALPAGCLTTDLVLTVTERLRREGVIAAIIEFFGEGVDALPVPERATLANMAPEYGASGGFFPVDRQTIGYLRQTRGDDVASLVEAYTRANGLFREAGAPAPAFTRTIAIDLGAVCRSVAGPRRPQDRVALADVGRSFREALTRPLAEGGFETGPDDRAQTPGETAASLDHGAIVVASITSCTNTSNPSVMLAAGLLAKKAAALGLRPPAHVRTSLAPGSRVVPRYLAEAGLMAPLESLGFHVVGFGCTVCAGKSGPLSPEIDAAIESDGVVAVSVLSGNRNFPGRIHRRARANYIMSPPLVVAFALAGRIDIDLTREPLGRTAEGREVLLADIWPTPEEIDAIRPLAAMPEHFRAAYADADNAGAFWSALDAPEGATFPWNPQSSYLIESPFAAGSGEPEIPERLDGARALCLFGDSLTTDHISPGGEIPPDSPAGRYLVARGVAPRDFNSYVARRGNPEIMARATFANARIVNLQVPDREGGWTRHQPSGEIGSIHATAERYRRENVPMIVVAGCEYGTGSSRDWAAKGPALLGVRAVLAESIERIHRSNLIALGIVPLLFRQGEGWRGLGLVGDETFAFDGLRSAIVEGSPLSVTARRNAEVTRFEAVADVKTDAERKTLVEGGMFAQVLAEFRTGAA